VNTGVESLHGLGTEPWTKLLNPTASFVPISPLLPCGLGCGSPAERLDAIEDDLDRLERAAAEGALASTAGLNGHIEVRV
jgi:hypothetical protein